MQIFDFSLSDQTWPTSTTATRPVAPTGPWSASGGERSPEVSASPMSLRAGRRRGQAGGAGP
jgi:hypothetical protein